MGKARILVVGLILSIMVPIVHLVILEAATSYMNSKPGASANNSNEIIHIEGVGAVAASNQVTVAWYSFTALDFLRDFLIGMMVYYLMVYFIRRLKRKS